jgi:hypothetical protein
LKCFADRSMKIHQDFKELLACFNAHKVEFLIVGGYALGEPESGSERPES